MPSASSFMCWLQPRQFMRTLAPTKAAEPWSLTSLRETLIRSVRKGVSHGRCATFQMAEVAISRQTFAEILSFAQTGQKGDLASNRRDSGEYRLKG